MTINRTMLIGLVCMAAILFLGVPVLAQTHPSSWIFYDGFERAPGVNFIPPWTEVRTIGGTQAITSTRPYAGNYSREVHHTSSGETEIMLHASGFNWNGSDTYYMRFYAYFDNDLRFSSQRKMIYQDPGDNTRVNFYLGTRHSGGSGWDALSDSSQSTIHIRNYNQPVGEPAWNGSDTEQLDGWYGSPGLVDSTPFLMNVGRWYCIEVMVRKSTTNGEIRVWLDGVEKIRFNKDTWGVASYNTGGHMPTCLELMGYFNFNPNHNGQAEWFDEVVIATAYIGPLGSTPPPTQPTQVSNFTGTADVDRVSLSWDNPSDSGFAGTMIRYSTSQYPASPQDGIQVCNLTGSPGSHGTYTHSGLSPSTAYYYSAFTYDSSGQYSSAVHLQVVTLAPPADLTQVANLVGAPDLKQVSLAWDNPSDSGFVGTVIRYSTTQFPASPQDGIQVCNLTGAPGSHASFVHANLSPNSPYYYAAFTYDSNGQYSGAVTLKVVTRPPSPKNLRLLDH